MTQPAITYSDFGEWYDQYRELVLEPALTQVGSLLDAELADVLSDRDLTRLRRGPGRVKSKRRTWRKIHQPRYAGRIETLDDIPRIIDDLIGVRITATNLRDIEMVQTALESLPHSSPGAGLWLDPSTERDYVVRPKASGYRGWHVNLATEVHGGAAPVAVTCELQVRTLLQDSWGELTHEETYSKDGALPPLIEVLSKRMADLFATLDDIAEDLRTELDRIDEAVIAESGDESPTQHIPAKESEQAVDAAAFLDERWRALDRPTDLAALAWAVQREFGAEISDDWFGHRTFKRFVGHALPDAELSTGRQVFVLPLVTDLEPEPEPDASVGVDTFADVAAAPASVHALRRVDRAFPLLDTAEWAVVFDELAAAWRRTGPQSHSPKSINRLAQLARDRAEASGRQVSRRHLAYVASAVLAADETGPLDASDVGSAFAAWTLQRMTDLRILGARNRKGRSAVRRWISGS